MLDPEAERPVARSLVITFRSIGSLKILNAGSAVSLTMVKSIFLFTRTHRGASPLSGGATISLS